MRTEVAVGYMGRKEPVLGVGVSVTDYASVVQACRSWIEARRIWLETGGIPAQAPKGRYICVTSVHGIVLATRNPAVKEALNRADITTPDGMPVVWAMRSFGVRNQQRVYGPDLMLAICAQAQELGHRIFLFGSREETIRLLRARLGTRFPRLKICGAYSPPFRPLTPDEKTHILKMIGESGADLVFAGMSTPKQDCWMAETAPLLPATVLVGVGAAFDFHAGLVTQAPPWMQNSGLEWLFRLAMEPGRLWKRYLVLTPVFLPLWALQKLRLLRFE